MHQPATAMVLLSLWLVQAAWPAPVPRTTCARDHLLVRFKPEVRAGLPEAGVAGQLTALNARLGLPASFELRETPLARILRAQAAPGSSPERAQVDLDRFLYLRLAPGVEVAEAVRLLENHPLLDYAEPDWVGAGAGMIPDDPNFPDQWHHQNPVKPGASIQTPLAWGISQGSTNVLVAVLDSGLADNQPEFAGRVLPGYNFAYTNDVTIDDHGHGTQVAGVLAANANNAFLGAGVDWRCHIMPVKVFDSSNYGLYSWWAQGIDYAVSNGCKVINLSAAGTEFGRTVQRAITNAIAQGVIVVTAAGNDGAPSISFPGYLTACITVGATDRQDRRAGFSNHGAQLDLVAPGVDLATAGPAGDLEYVRGTSFSAPLVAGVCALLAAVRPNLTQADARLLLCAGADDQIGDATDTPGHDNHYGWGRLNAFQSLLLATTRVDEIWRTSGLVELSWRSPANASNKQPYQVEYRSSLSAPWILLTNASAFRYETNRTHWTDDGSQTGHAAGFYRVGLRTF